MEDLQRFVVVEFLLTKEVSTVLKSWLLNEAESYWPDKNPRSALVKGFEPDKENWEKWSIRILDSYDNLQVAINKERRAQVTSDLATTDGEGNSAHKRKRSSRKPLRLIQSSSESESEEDLPDFRQSKKRTKTHEDVLSHIPEPSSALAKSLTPSPLCNKLLSPLHNTPGPSCLRSTENLFRSNDNTTDQSLRKMQDQMNTIERIVLQNKVDLKAILEILQNQPPSSAENFKCVNTFDEKFPLKEISQVEDLNNSLLKDEDRVKELTNYLRLVGGTSVEDATRRILIRLFTNEVGREFSWEGRGGKKMSLKNLFLIQIIGRVSSVSSATNSSSGSHHSEKCRYPRQPISAPLRKSQTQSMKYRLQEYKEPVRGEPQEKPRLPPIQEFQREFRAGKERSTSTRIRCAQKIVTQLETTPLVSNNNKMYFRSPLKPQNKEIERKKKINECQRQRVKEDRLKEDKITDNKKKTEDSIERDPAVSKDTKDEKCKKTDKKDKKEEKKENKKENKPEKPKEEKKELTKAEKKEIKKEAKAEKKIAKKEAKLEAKKEKSEKKEKNEKKDKKDETVKK